VLTKITGYHRRSTVGDYSILMGRKNSKLNFEDQSLSSSLSSMKETDSLEIEPFEVDIGPDEIDRARYARTIVDCEIVRLILNRFAIKLFTPNAA